MARKGLTIENVPRNYKVLLLFVFFFLFVFRIKVTALLDSNKLYLKNGNPRNKYVVKANSSPSWIVALLFALRVILIPVYTFI